MVEFREQEKLQDHNPGLQAQEYAGVQAKVASGLHGASD